MLMFQKFLMFSRLHVRFDSTIYLDASCVFLERVIVLACAADALNLLYRDRKALN